MPPKKVKKSGKCDLNPPTLRFLITVCSVLEEKEQVKSFIQKASDYFGIYLGALAHRLYVEMSNEMEFEGDVPVPGKLPAIYADIQSDSSEATAERDKLQMITELLRYGEETLDDILSLVDKPIVKYCPFCKYLGYNKDHYLNHNFKGGHTNDYICPAAIYMIQEKL